MSFDIEEMYKRYGPMVYRRCRNLLYDEDAALDAMQEVFVNLVRFSARLNNTAPSSLLYTMSTNHCLNVIAARKRAPVSPAEGFFENIPGRDRFVDSVHARDLLETVFAKHDERTRTIAWLHYVDGLTLEETAKEVGMSVSGIRKRLRNLQASSIGVGDN